MTRTILREYNLTLTEKTAFICDHFCIHYSLELNIAQLAVGSDLWVWLSLPFSVTDFIWFLSSVAKTKEISSASKTWSLTRAF